MLSVLYIERRRRKKIIKNLREARPNSNGQGHCILVAREIWVCHDGYVLRRNEEKQREGECQEGETLK